MAAYEKLQKSLQDHTVKNLAKPGVLKKFKEIDKKISNYENLNWRGCKDRATDKLTKGKFKSYDEYEKYADSLVDEQKKRVDKVNDYIRQRWERGDEKMNMVYGKFPDRLLKEKNLPTSSKVYDRAFEIDKAKDRLLKIQENKQHNLFNQFKSYEALGKSWNMAGKAYQTGNRKRFNLDELEATRNNKKAWNKLEKEAKEEFVNNGGKIQYDPNGSSDYSNISYNVVNLTRKNNPLTSIHEIEHAKGGKEAFEGYDKLIKENKNPNYKDGGGNVYMRNNVPIEELRADNGIIRRIKNNPNLKPSQKKQMIAQAKKFRRSQLKNGYDVNIK